MLVLPKLTATHYFKCNESFPRSVNPSKLFVCDDRFILLLCSGQIFFLCVLCGWLPLRKLNVCKEQQMGVVFVLKARAVCLK